MKKLLFILFTLTLISLNGYTQVYLNWQRFTDGTAHLDDSAVAVDVEETATNVYVGGNVNNTATLNDIVIKNYDLSGNLVWSGGYASPLNDHLAWFLCDGSPNAIYGAGNSDNGSYLIGLLIKMDMNGKLLWSKTFTGTGNTMFESLKVAPNGNIIVVGEIMVSQIACNGIVASYDSTGKFLWSKTVGGTSGESEFNHLEIDGSGNIYASGYKYNGTNEDGYIAKYNATGKLLNSITINGAGNKDDEVKGLELMNGVLYAATVGRGTGLYDEATVSAYNPSDFSSLWSKNYSSVNGDINLAGILDTSIPGSLILAGTQANLAGTSDYLLFSYDATTGDLNWAKTISRGKGYNNIATAMTVDASGDFLITGVTDLAGAHDYYTVCYDHLGNLLWTKVFNGAVNGDDYPTAIGTDANGNIFIGGTSAQATSLTPGKSNQDFTLLKYSSNLICSMPTNLFSDSITTTSAKLHWDAMPEALKYKLQYRVAGGTWVTVNSNTTTKTLTGLTAKTKYQWRVKTVCSNNPAVSSGYSATQSFYTAAGFAETSVANGILNTHRQTAFQIFPNPATQKINLVLTGISGSNIEVKLYDLAGKELKHYQFAISGKTFNQQIDVSTLSPGSYVVVVSGNDIKYSQVLMKQ